MGAHEPVRQLLEPLGATVGTVDMQPGGPQAYARYREVPVVCFPGNPVSSQLSFALFVAPLLRELAGLPPVTRLTRTLGAPLESIPGRRQFLRARLRPDGSVETVSGPGSHLVAALAAADVLIDVPADVTALPAGAPVDTVDL
jgi:molybdopterin molybdotransferase